jgi:hypothetical protein
VNADDIAAEMGRTVRWCDDATNQFMEMQGSLHGDAGESDPTPPQS